MPVDIFDHHHGIVDDEADRDRERHQSTLFATVDELCKRCSTNEFLSRPRSA